MEIDVWRANYNNMQALLSFQQKEVKTKKSKERKNTTMKNQTSFPPSQSPLRAIQLDADNIG